MVMQRAATLLVISLQILPVLSAGSDTTVFLQARVTGLSASVAVSSPTIPVSISTDGTCGGGITCLGSTWGQCCSAHGFCGSSADYCGVGCDGTHGRCELPGDRSSSVSSSLAPPTSASTATPAPDVVTVPCRTTVVAGTSWVTATTRITRTATSVSLEDVAPATTTYVTVTTTATVFRAATATTTTVTVVAPGKPIAGSVSPSPLLPGTINTCMACLSVCLYGAQMGKCVLISWLTAETLI